MHAQKIGLEGLNNDKIKTREWLPEYDYLTKQAWLARKNSYSPYSKFAVGAALITNDSKVYTGCNIENSVFGVTVCAERTALFKAISNGDKEFKMIVILGNPNDKDNVEITPPCGVCRQALREFCNPNNFWVLLPKTDEAGQMLDFKIQTLEELLPNSFGPANLSQQIVSWICK